MRDVRRAVREMCGVNVRVCGVVCHVVAWCGVSCGLCGVKGVWRVVWDVGCGLCGVGCGVSTHRHANLEGCQHECLSPARRRLQFVCIVSTSVMFATVRCGGKTRIA